MEGIGPAGDHLQTLPVDSICFFIFFKVFKESRHTEEGAGLVFLHRKENVVNIRGGEQDHGATAKYCVEHNYYLAVNMVEGQEGQNHLFAFFDDRPGCINLGLTGNQVTVG